MKFDAPAQRTANAVLGRGVDGSIVSLPYSQQLSLADARALTVAPDAPVYITSNGGGTFVYDSTDTTTPDNAGTCLVTAGGHRIRRQFSGGIELGWFATAPLTTGQDITALITAALPVAATLKRDLLLPAGSYTIGPIALAGSGVTIRGAGREKTTLVRNSTRGYALSGKLDYALLCDLTIDCNASLFEGGIRLAGIKNVVRNVAVLNGDLTSITISTLMNNADTAVESRDNLVENCLVRGQKRYHEAAGLSPILAGDGAIRTTFRDCLVEDCAASVSIDYYDSDNAPGTLFENCVARQTSGRALGTGFWAEGEQTGQNHSVTWINCRAVNMTNAFGSSEEAMVTLLNGRATNCVRSYTNLNGTFVPNILGLLSIGCGAGLEGTDTDGIVTSTGGLNAERLVFVGSLAKHDLVNYTVGAATQNPFRVTTSQFAKLVRIGYTNANSALTVSFDACTFAGGAASGLHWTVTPNVRYTLSRLKFLNGATISGAMCAVGSRLTNSEFFGMGAGTAITQNPSSANLIVERTFFSGWAAGVDANTVVGEGNTESGNTTPLPAYKVLSTPDTLQVGDILYHDGTTLKRLPKGANGQFLKIIAGLPAWSN